MFRTNTDKTVNSWQLLLAVCFLLGGLFVFVLLASHLLDMPLEHFTADPAAIYGAHPFAGMISNIGILLWCISASICLFCAVLIGRKDSEHLFFLCSGIFITMLLLDDLFQIHEAIIPWYLKIPEEIVYGFYGILTISFAYYFRHHSLNTDYKLLLTAAIFLALSVFGDMILPQEGVAYLIEDLFKILGISTLSLYFLVTSYYTMNKRLTSSRGESNNDRFENRIETDFSQEKDNSDAIEESLLQSS